MFGISGSDCWSIKNHTNKIARLHLKAVTSVPVDCYLKSGIEDIFRWRYNPDDFQSQIARNISVSNLSWVSSKSKADYIDQDTTSRPHDSCSQKWELCFDIDRRLVLRLFWRRQIADHLYIAHRIPRNPSFFFMTPGQRLVCQKICGYPHSRSADPDEKIYLDDWSTCVNWWQPKVVC